MLVRWPARKKPAPLGLTRQTRLRRLIADILPIRAPEARARRRMHSDKHADVDRPIVDNLLSARAGHTGQRRRTACRAALGPVPADAGARPADRGARSSLLFGNQ